MLLDGAVLAMHYGRPCLTALTKSDPPLLMRSGTNPEHHVICQHSNDKEVKGLGVFMNFYGTFAVHAHPVRFKFDGLARRLRKSSMSSILSRVYYNTFYDLPAVMYSLPATQIFILDPVNHIPSVNRFLRVSRTKFVLKHHDERTRSTTATWQHTK